VHGPDPSLKVGFGLIVNLTPLLGVFPPAVEVVQVTVMAPAANTVLVMLVPATTVLTGTMWGLSRLAGVRTGRHPCRATLILGSR
jgi:hypothetical protein